MKKFYIFILWNHIFFFFFQLRFFAVGFILYFPSSDPYWIWSVSHGHILILTVIFVWVAIGICLFLFIQSSIIWYLLKQKRTDNDIFDKELVTKNSIDINDSEDDDDDDDNDSQF